MFINKFTIEVGTSLPIFIIWLTAMFICIYAIGYYFGIAAGKKALSKKILDNLKNHLCTKQP